MPTNLPKTTVKFLVALLKHQAELWLGKDASGILGDDVQERLNDWLKADETAKKLLKAAEQAQIYLQDPRNCPDDDLRHVFRDMGFGDLPSVQSALANLPQAMDPARVRDALFDSFERDLPNLTSAQQAEGARIYTYALLDAVGSIADFTLPIVRQVVIDNAKKLDSLGVGQAEIKALIEKLFPGKFAPAPSPTLPGDLPFGSYLPLPPNQFFTGREQQLESLAQSILSNETNVAITQQALVGMGGIGKTQLAVQFAWTYGHKFAGVHWASAYKAEEINSSIALCGQAMELQPWPSQVEQQAFVTTNAMKNKGPRLVILDNLEIYENTSELLARLRHSNIRLLITSRDHELIQKLNIPIFALGPFTPDESLLFLRNNLTSDRADDDELKELSELLHHKPIELDRAVYSLKRYNHLTVKELIKQNKLNHPIRTEIMSDFQTQKMSMALQFLKDQEEVSFVPKHLADVYRTKILDRWLEEFFK